MKKNKILAVTVAVFMLFSVCTECSFAGSKSKSMVAYKSIIKSGSIVYCMLPGVILAVDEKTDEINRLTDRMVLIPHVMKLHKGYLYYSQADQESSNLNRINLNTEKNKRLVWGYNYKLNFAISGSKIYYTTGNSKKVMKLDGTSKKKSSYSVKMKKKDSNVSGYKIKTVFSDDFYYDHGYFHSWLIKPGNTKVDLGVWYAKDIFEQ